MRVARTLTSHIAKCAIIIRSNSFMHTISDILEFFRVSRSSNQLIGCESWLYLACLDKPIDCSLNFSQKSSKLFVVFPCVLRNLQRFDIEEVIDHESTCLGSHHCIVLAFPVAHQGLLDLVLQLGRLCLLFVVVHPFLSLSKTLSSALLTFGQSLFFYQ